MFKLTRLVLLLVVGALWSAQAKPYFGLGFGVGLGGRYGGYGGYGGYGDGGYIGYENGGYGGYGDGDYGGYGNGGYGGYGYYYPPVYY